MSDKTLTIDGCDDAVIGCIMRCGQVPIVVYDRAKLVECFVGQGMSDEEADEWVAFNIEGAWLGEGTPGILIAGSHDDVQEMLQ